MKNCSYCGSEMNDNAEFCPCCGANVNAANNTATATATDGTAPVQATVAAQTEKHPWLTVLGFFIPLAALIMWLVWKDSEPSKALAVGKGGLMYVSLSPIVGLVCYLITKDKYADIAKACGICAIIGLVLSILYMVLYIGLFAFIITMGAY